MSIQWNSMKFFFVLVLSKFQSLFDFFYMPNEYTIDVNRFNFAIKVKQMNMN